MTKRVLSPGARSRAAPRTTSGQPGESIAPAATSRAAKLQVPALAGSKPALRTVAPARRPLPGHAVVGSGSTSVTVRLRRGRLKRPGLGSAATKSTLLSSLSWPSGQRARLRAVTSAQGRVSNRSVAVSAPQPTRSTTESARRNRNASGPFCKSMLKRAAAGTLSPPMTNGVAGPSSPLVPRQARRQDARVRAVAELEQEPSQWRR
jgi:hypothetical protein